MSPRTKAAIFIAIALVWFGLAAISAMNGYWLVALVDVLAAAVMIFLGYRTTHPNVPTATATRPLRAPRPPR
jgi:hypothetical protein